MFSVAIQGALLSGSMIIAIGSQNAFLLKAGLKNNYAFSVASVCFFGDIILMTVGVFGIGSLVAKNDQLQIFMAYSGAAFLFWYGYTSLRSSIKGNNTLNIEVNNEKTKRTPVILSSLAITFLNPHVYLDTVVIIGGVASQFSFEEKLWFIFGSLISSMVWFYGLGFTATKITPLFKKQITWRILDAIISLIMFYIGLKLIVWAFSL